MYSLAIALSIVAQICYVISVVLPKGLWDTNLQVKTQNGVLQGTVMYTNKKSPYYAYQGIPYAKPPLHDLRFKATIPSSNWTGVLDATKQGASCIEMAMRITGRIETPGQEDCLFLNVYVPQKPDSIKSPLAVMVWIYGGGFNEGASNVTLYNPEYFMDENVIIVTFNYRVGPYGFLSTGDLTSPGNYGLKDQHLALRWVKQNIKNFGGNPNRITIFGQSAGAASIQYHLQYPKSKGLFNGAIIQSGSSLCPWALQRRPANMAYLLGVANGIVDVKSSEELVTKLRKVNVQDLKVAQVGAVLAKSITFYVNGLAFAPTMEPDHSEAFVTKKSFEVLNEGTFLQVPVMMGLNSQESLTYRMLVKRLQNFLRIFENDDANFVPKDMNIASRGTIKKVANIVKRHYFKRGRLTTASLDEILNFFSKEQWAKPITKSIELMSKHTPVYFYEFAYEGDLALETVYEEVLPRELGGVGHVEELAYLWKKQVHYVKNSQSKSTEDRSSKADKLMVRRMVKLWTNFAKFGNPTPKKEKLLGNVVWKPVNPNKIPDLDYLEINGKLKLKSNFKRQDIDFWNELYHNFSHSPLDTY